MSDPEISLRIDTKYEYDHEEGVLNITDGLMRQAIEVRVRLEDAIVRQAIIIELERLGYTVISPEPKG